MEQDRFFKKVILPPQTVELPFLSQQAEDLSRAYPDNSVFANHRTQEIYTKPHEGGEWTLAFALNAIANNAI